MLKTLQSLLPSLTLSLTAKASFGNNDEDLVDTSEAARVIGITEYSVRRLIRYGHLPAFRSEGVKGYRIRKEDLQEYLRKRNKNQCISPNLMTKDKKSFENTVKNLAEKLVNDRESVDPDILNEFLRGKQLDLQGLQLKRKKLEIESRRKTSPDEETELEMINLDIEINDLAKEIQALNVILNSFQDH